MTHNLNTDLADLLAEYDLMTPAELAAHCRKLGVRGKPGDAQDNPVARLLSRRFYYAEIVGAGVTVSDNREGDEDPERDGEADLCGFANVRAFHARWLAGEWPELLVERDAVKIVCSELLEAPIDPIWQTGKVFGPHHAA